MNAALLPIGRRVWKQKYRRTVGGRLEATIADTWVRVARAVAAPEGAGAEAWERRFLGLLDDCCFLPGGRILAGAGAGNDVTLFNCFVMGPIEDSVAGIFNALQEGALTLQAGGGVGYDFSTLRPAGFPARRTHNTAAGPVAFMGIWDAMCHSLSARGSRRGAMMASLRCDHPDIEAFVDAKRQPGHLTHFNCSVLVTQAFLRAVAEDAPWPLVFPQDPGDTDVSAEILQREWSGQSRPVACRVVRTVAARTLWSRLMHAAYVCSEPGVLFLDRMNARNNLHYRERILTTNPCGEVPLPPYGACNLGSFNLTRFVESPFARDARFDVARLRALVPVAVRFLDNVTDISRFPLSAQRDAAVAARRIGIGFTGLGDTLAMLGLRYDSEPGRRFAAGTMALIREEAYRASIDLAAERGAFPAFSATEFAGAPNLDNLPREIRDDIRRRGIRNSHLTAIAPAGSISLLAGNVSSGIEPIFQLVQKRRLRGGGDRTTVEALEDYAYRRWRTSGTAEALPESFITAQALTPDAHLLMQAAVQPFVDGAISKTINVAEDLPFDAFEDIYLRANALGLKGCAVHRPNPVTGSVYV